MLLPVGQLQPFLLCTSARNAHGCGMVTASKEECVQAQREREGVCRRAEVQLRRRKEQTVGGIGRLSQVG